MSDTTTDDNPRCPHCGSDKGTWFSRTEPMGDICEECGENVAEPPKISATKRWMDEDEQKTYRHLYSKERAIIDRLCADLDKQQCANPDATTCAKQWEADHQRAALEQHGLADEFPYGPNAIEHVAAALVDARARLDKQQEVIGKLVGACDATTAQWDEATRPGAACEDCPDPHHVAMSREAAAAARAGEGRG